MLLPIITEIIVTGASDTIRNLVLCNTTSDTSCVYPYIHFNLNLTLPPNKLYATPCINSCTKVIGINNSTKTITLSKKIPVNLKTLKLITRSKNTLLIFYT